METVVDEISSAAHILGLSTDVFRRVPDDQAEVVFHAAREHFVKSGDRRWWWEDFRMAASSLIFPIGDGWEHLLKIVPDPEERVWFIVEEDQLPFYPVYEATPRAIKSVLGECYAFEYYLVEKSFAWLLCETHHNVMYAVGVSVEQRLLRLELQGG